jgi:hypothetical protein
MAFLDLHDWSLTALLAVLFAASLSLQSLPAGRGMHRDAPVCEKPGLAAWGVFPPLH